ncbi:hypothetical protein BBP40_000368 [Aspergillus hancockii]|nr:hypothetical protein BBP40_000368 [Aspergillus hancockii]
MAKSLFHFDQYLCLFLLGFAERDRIFYYSLQVQGLSALQSSIRLLPHVIIGTAVSIATAFLISRVKVQTLAVGSGLITLAAPVPMATVKVNENFWLAPFWALFVSC